MGVARGRDGGENLVIPPMGGYRVTKHEVTKFWCAFVADLGELRL